MVHVMLNELNLSQVWLYNTALKMCSDFARGLRSIKYKDHIAATPFHCVH